jgi:hypothetical protein
VAVGADVFAVDQVAELQIGQLFGQRNRIQRVAGRAKTEQISVGPRLKALIG